MRKGDGVLVIWPAYFDVDRTRSQGRIVPKGLSVESPTAEEIYEVCSALNKSPVLEGNKRLPSATWSRPGRVIIKKEGAKLKAVREIATSLQKKRAAAKKK